MVVVTNKVTGSSSNVSGNNVVLSAPSVVKLSLSPRAIADYQKVGEDLIIHLHNGETIRIVHFYAHYPNGDDNDLVLEDDDGKLWVGNHSEGLADFNFAEIQSVDQLVGGTSGGVSPILLGLLGIGAGAGIIAAASSSGDDDDDDGPGVDRDPPAALFAALENDTGIADDGITGDGTVVIDGLEAGASWEYSTDGGITWHKGSGSSFELEQGTYADGDILVRQIDASGNVGPVTSMGPVTVDVTPPTTNVAITDPEGDNIPTASGTTEPGSTVTVTWPDGTTSEVTADGTTGEWTATAPGEQPDGDVTAAVTDPAGNTGSGTGTWTATDTTPPDTSATTVTVGPIAGDGVVNATEAAGNVPVTVTIANPPADAATTTVNILVDGVPYAAVSNGDGTWTASVPGSALAGATTPEVTAEAVFTDAAGNDAAPVTDTQTYTVDVTPPTTNVAITDPEGDNIPTASGTTEPGSTVTVTWPDGTTSEVTADGTTGEWTATAPGEQPDGDVTAAVTDPAGNTGSGTGTWTATDTTPPDTSATTVTVGPIAGDGVVNATEAAGNVPVTVTIANPPADAATTTVNILVDGVPYAAVSNGDGTWTASVPGSALAGATTPEVTAEAVFTDAAGNDAAPVTDTQTYTVDVTPPTTNVAITDPEGDNIPTASGTTEPGSTVTVTWPDGTTSEVTADGTTGEWTATAPGEQPDGDVTAAVTDPAGNTGSGTGTWTATDTTPPDTSATTVTVGPIAGDGVVNATEAAGNVPVTVTIANPPADAATTTVNILVDGVPYAAVSNGDGTWTASVPGSALAGATTPEVTAEAVFTDAAGNDAAPVTDTQTYTVDVTPPTTNVAITDPEGDNIPTASGTTEPGSTVTVTWPDGTTSEVTADGTTGEWTATAPGEQPDGDVTAAVTDPAGNTGSGTGTWTATDTTPVASDDLVNASVDIVPTETAVDNGSTTYLLGIGIGLGLIDLQATVLGVPSVEFTITDGHTQDLTFAFGGLADVGVLGDYQVVVQKWDALTGQWTSVDGSSAGGSILNIGLLDGGANGVAIPDMDAGQYRAFMVYNGVGLSVLTTMTVSGQDHDYINTSVVTSEATGNVLDNDGGAAAAGHIVTSVNFNGTDYPVPAGPAGTTIIGQYGQLAIHQDGSYTYTPNADGTAIGKVDQFTYTLHDPVGNTDTQATLYVRIDSEGQGLVWSETDPAADATYSVAATDDAADLSIIWVNPTDDLFDQSQSLVGVAIIGASANSNQFVIGSNLDATGTITVAATLAVLSSGTITIQKLVGGNWQDISTDTFNVVAGVLGTVKSINISDLNLDAGTYRVHSQLSGLAVVSVTTDVDVTHTDQHVIAGDPSIDGSLVANDGIVPEGSRVVVSDGGTFVDATAAGTVIHGLHGDLTVYSNGTYKYEPLDTLAYADREATDSFTYKIVLPSGYETTAELVVQLHDGSAVAFANVTGDPVSAESFSMEPSGDVVALNSLAGSDASDTSSDPMQHNLSEALLLDDGSGGIVLPSSDSETGAGRSADVTVNSTNDDPIMVDDSSTVNDPLGYLAPDPLTQEDPLHTVHMV
ncbi:BapA/Bap/LapF family large adhesin [Brucella pituitosa]|uniref:BapA/Bap/LapF family large adhesin n=1 Tax=Brucella pituitosa TaxID=571256 RepID=UPI003F4AE706